jgi:hypothetical protein
MSASFVRSVNSLMTGAPFSDGIVQSAGMIRDAIRRRRDGGRDALVASPEDLAGRLAHEEQARAAFIAEVRAPASDTLAGGMAAVPYWCRQQENACTQPPR